MTKEQIEKAATNLLLNDPFELRETSVSAFQQGFITGVEWYRKTLWRNSTDEQPQAGRRILVIEKDGIWTTTMSQLAVLVPGVLWCYVDDLMSKEEKK